MVLDIVDAPLDNPHAGRSEPHYRLYLDQGGVPTVVEVQDFDYVDYDPARFLTTDAYDDERTAQVALAAFMTPLALDVVKETRPADVAVAHAMVRTGRATREQAMLAFLSAPPQEG